MQIVSQQAGVNPSAVFLRLGPLALLLVREIGLEQRKIDADERRMRETLMFETLITSDLCLSVIVDQDEAAGMDQRKQAYQAANGPIVV